MLFYGKDRDTHTIDTIRVREAGGCPYVTFDAK